MYIFVVNLGFLMLNRAAIPAWNEIQGISNLNKYIKLALLFKRN